MPGFTESSITLNFPDINYFRFQDWIGYRNLSAFNFKEMDACWYDSSNNIYWVVELKDLTSATLSKSDTFNSIKWNLLKKAVDSLCMFLSLQHNYSYNRGCCGSLPKIPDNMTKFKFLVIIHCDQSQRPNIQLLNNSFRSCFKPYASLFEIIEYGVIEHSLAVKNLPYNMVQ